MEHRPEYFDPAFGPGWRATDTLGRVTTEQAQTERVTVVAEDFIVAKNEQWMDELEVGRLRCFKDIGREGWHCWAREAWTFHIQNNLPWKVFVIERLRMKERRGTPIDPAEGVRVGDVEYRFGYWIVGRIGRASGRWTWGQFPPLIPPVDLDDLLAKARAEGTLLP